MKALVVDDERLAVERLKRLLDLDRRVEVMASFTDSIEACAYLNGNCPDVLFLDIEMHEMTGFHLLAQLEVQPMVVFTTAYDQFALCAFEVNSIDYLLKPVETKRLNRAIGKVERILCCRSPENVDF
jgi:two-component system, LytTR family, response regulator